MPGIDKLITHRFPLSDAARAFELMAAGRDTDGRALIKAVVEG